MSKKGTKVGIKSLLKKLLLGAAVIYTAYILIQQQISLNAYKTQTKYYQGKIAEEHKKQEKLERLEMLYNTDMFIERIARDKLGLVKQGERVFIDISEQWFLCIPYFLGQRFYMGFIKDAWCRKVGHVSALNCFSALQYQLLDTEL